jgi:hypothetical protein
MLMERADAASCRPFASPETEVWLALGQSNAANHAEVRYTAAPGVAAFDGRRCSPAKDPLPGGDGAGGSLWTPMAQAWVVQGRAKQVLIAVTARSSTSIAEWQPRTRLHRQALEKIEALKRRGLRVHRILWLQGEADVILGTSERDYAQRLAATLEPLHRQTQAPVFIASVGRCGDAASASVPAAQAQVIAAYAWAFAGPNLDAVAAGERYQRCHFARAGQARAVNLWLAALRAAPRF